MTLTDICLNEQIGHSSDIKRPVDDWLCIDDVNQVLSLRNGIRVFLKRSG